MLLYKGTLSLTIFKWWKPRVLYVLQEESRINRREDSRLAYCINDAPPWYLSIVLGFQVPQPLPVLMHGIIYSSLELNLITCLLALLDDVRFNTGHSSRFSQAHVLWSESLGYQRDYWHHIFCVWNLYFITNDVWKQVKYNFVRLLSNSFCDMTQLKDPWDHVLTNEAWRVSVHENITNWS